MTSPPHDLRIPPDAAVAATDGCVADGGSSTGVVFLRDGMARVTGSPLGGSPTAWEAEVAAVAAAVAMAIDAGVGRLRLLVDRYDLAYFIQGRRSDEPRPWNAPLEECVARAAGAGLALSARLVQGHTETGDLPSMLNHVAHIACDAGLAGGLDLTLPAGPSWLGDLARLDDRFRKPRTHFRWNAELQRRKVSRFLGVDVGTVDDLVSAGHLVIGSGGVTRASAARVYEAAQALRHDGFFGFDDPEGVPGRETGEVCRGWDGRPARRPTGAEGAHSPGPAAAASP